jgi:hypothetical protein
VVHIRPSALGPIFYSAGSCSVGTWHSGSDRRGWVPGWQSRAAGLRTASANGKENTIRLGSNLHGVSKVMFVPAS